MFNPLESFTHWSGLDKTPYPVRNSISNGAYRNAIWRKALPFLTRPNKKYCVISLIFQTR